MMGKGRGMRYTEFREIIRKALKENPEGRTWKELKEELNLPYRTPCPEWIKRLELEIGLERKQKRGNALVWKLGR